MSAPGNNELWFCHECHAEMRPLMVPNAQCPNCHSDFVERIENSGSANDDPREFMHVGADDLGFGPGNGGAIDLLGLLGAMLQNQPAAAPRRRPGGGGSGFRFEMRTGGSGGEGATRTFTLGNPQPGMFDHDHVGGQNRPPPLGDFLDGAFQPGSPRDDAPGGRRRREINLQEHPFGPALLAFLGGHPAFAQGGNGRGGQFGDYVFDQEGLDAVITQLMEANNANRPIPASEDLIRDLPRRKATVQDYLDAAEDVRGRECAVCKDTLLPSPDSDEAGPATLVKLPCKHEFHEDCIVPWLQNNSGTCPVCRHELVDQPHHAHATDARSPAAAEGGGGGGGGVTGLIRNAASSIMDRLRHGGHSSGSSPDSQPTSQEEGGSSSSRSGPSSPTTSAVPGSYETYRATPTSSNRSPPISSFAPYRPVSPVGGSPAPRPSERPSHRRTGSGGYVLGNAPRSRYASPPRTGSSPGTSPSSGSYFGSAGSPSSQRASGGSGFVASRHGRSSSPTDRERRPNIYSFRPPAERYDPRSTTGSGSAGRSTNNAPGQGDNASRHPAPPGAWEELD